MTDALATPLAGRCALVTGASSGIGRAIALACARAGANVALTYRTNEDGAREVERDILTIGRRAAVLRLDLSNDRAIGLVGRDAHDAIGPIDVWINNAGADILTGPDASLSTLDKLDRLLTVDLRGTIVASWQAVEMMRAQENGGVIINMSWDHVLTGMRGINPQLFAAVKGGVLAFSKSLARTVAPQVRVNVIAPGWIKTSFGDTVETEMGTSIVESTPLARWGTPDDVAGAVVFLASPAAAFMTGQTLLVGGGVVM